MSRTTIYDRKGNLLAEIEPHVKRKWIINDIGTAEFELVGVKQEIVQYGNLVLVEHETIIPWVGKIVPPRIWSSGGQFRVNAKSAEYLLFGRRYLPNVSVDGPWGDVFGMVVDIANKEEDTRIRKGDIWDGGKNYEKRADMTNLWKYIQYVATNSLGCRISFTPTFDSLGKLVIMANLHPKGWVNSDLFLMEGINIQDKGNILREQGEIFNDVLAFSDASTWRSKDTYIATDENSRDLYGLVQTSVSAQGGAGMGYIEDIAKIEILNRKKPWAVLGLNAIDVNNTFKQMDLGMRYQVKLTSMGFKDNDELGFEGFIKIKAMSYDDKSGVLALVGMETP